MDNDIQMFDIGEWPLDARATPERLHLYRALDLLYINPNKYVRVKVQIPMKIAQGLAHKHFRSHAMKVETRSDGEWLIARLVPRREEA